jgi:transposase
MTLPSTWIGIDVSKAWLDIAGPVQGRSERIANRPETLAAFADGLAGRGTAVVFEATGAYDRALRHALAAAGVGYARVNPQRARDFARATGQLAKTDAIDAAMLARMGQALHLSADQLPEQERERLALLGKRRDQLVAMRMQEKARRAETGDDALLAGLDDHLAWLDTAIADVEHAVRDLIGASPALAADEALIRSMPGIGPVAATTLIALMPELGRRSPKQIAMLAGLAPVNNDSGARRGQRRIRAGRRRVRQALYMAAVASLTTTSPMKAVYARLRNAGKPAKVAIIALARKMLVTLNAIVRTRKPFTP